MYTRSLLMISWMTLVRICCLLSACLWGLGSTPPSCSSPWPLLELSGGSSWLTRSCRRQETGTGGLGIERQHQEKGRRLLALASPEPVGGSLAMASVFLYLAELQQ